MPCAASHPATATLPGLRAAPKPCDRRAAAYRLSYSVAPFAVFRRARTRARPGDPRTARPYRLIEHRQNPYTYHPSAPPAARQGACPGGGRGPILAVSRPLLPGGASMNDAEFRLPRHVRPERYTVHLAPDLDAWSFTGDETILLTLDRPVRRVELHALDLEITRAEVTAARRRQTARVAYHPARETAELRFAEPLPAGRATLRLAFRGTIGTGLRGLYRAEAGGRRYAFTQFEATDARRAFPCFDEPAFKARFNLSATVPDDLVAISNGRLLREEPGPRPGTKTVTFATTPRMSTYLVALAVGALEATEAALARGGVPIRVWT